jgi:hypothetical protein
LFFSEIAEIAANHAKTAAGFAVTVSDRGNNISGFDTIVSR